MGHQAQSSKTACVELIFSTDRLWRTCFITITISVT